jgi:amino acid transporter
VAVGVACLAFTVFACIATGFTAFSAFELTSDTAGVIVAGAYATACAAAGVVLWRSPRRRAWSVIPALGVLALLAVIGLQLFPLPSGWELIAPTVAVVALVVGAVVGRARGDRASRAWEDAPSG